MKWQGLIILAIGILLIMPMAVSATNLWTISGGSDVSNESYWYADSPIGIKDDSGNWTSVGWFSKLFGGATCFTPTNSTTYTIGVDIMSTNIVLCPGTYSDVSFVFNQSNTTLDCAGSTFIDSGTGSGIQISFGSNYNTVHDCNIYNYTYGILNIGNNGTFYNNNLSLNDIGARNSPSTTGNLFHNNYFSNNSVANAQDLSFTPANFWNTTKDCLSGPNIIGGLCRGGNYWSDYTGVDENFDGIGDTNIPYSVSINAQDYLPLTNEHELPDAGFLAISFIIGFMSIAFILAWLSTTLGLSTPTFTRKTGGEMGGFVDIEDKPGYSHWPLRIYFLLLCMLTIVADLHIIAALERDFIASSGNLTNALIDKLPYAILLVPIFYLLVTVIMRMLKSMNDQRKQNEEY